MRRIEWDSVAMWTALLVYFASWTLIPLLIPLLILGSGLWYVGVTWAVVYVLSHAREIVRKGHCYLSADSTAFPAVVLTGIVLAVLLKVSDVTSVTANGAAYIRAFGMSFVLGHILSIAEGVLMLVEI